MIPRVSRHVVLAVLVLGTGALAPAFANAPTAAAQKAADAAPVPTERLLGELRRRNDALDQRERDLGQRERSLADLEREAKSTLALLEDRRAQVESRIAVLQKLAGDGPERLAKVYAAMPAARAAELLAKLDPEVAAVVLNRMKPKLSANVMAAMDSERALQLTELAALPVAAPDLVDPRLSAPSAPPPVAPAGPDEAPERFR